MRARARVCAVAAGVAIAATLAGCGTTTTSAGSSSSLMATGTTLSIYLSVPPSAAGDPAQQDVLRAEQLACAQDASEVTHYKIRCVRVTGRKLSDNARTAIVNGGAIAYIGELAPGASADSVGITNALDLLQVSPTDNAIELTQTTAAVKNSPSVFYEDWSVYGRSFARVVPSAAEEARAQIAEMRAQHVTSLYVADDGSDYGRAIALAVTQDAPPAISLARSEASADAVFYGGTSAQGAARFFAAAPAAAKRFGPSGLDTPAFAAAMPSGARNVYISSPGFLSRDLTPAGRQFVSQFTAAVGHTPAMQAIFGYEAVAATLYAIQKAGAGADDRETVIKDFFGIKDRSSVLGPYSIDPQGDTSLDAFVFSRLRAGALVPLRSAP